MNLKQLIMSQSIGSLCCGHVELRFEFFDISKFKWTGLSDINEFLHNDNLCRRLLFSVGNMEDYPQSCFGWTSKIIDNVTLIGTLVLSMLQMIVN